MDTVENIRILLSGSQAHAWQDPCACVALWGTIGTGSGCNTPRAPCTPYFRNQMFRHDGYGLSSKRGAAWPGHVERKLTDCSIPYMRTFFGCCGTLADGYMRNSKD